MAETEEFPKEVKEGILIPLPKPGMKPGLHDTSDPYYYYWY